MLSKLFESLYNKIFVNIIVGRSKTTIYIEECKKDKVINSDTRVFDITHVDAKMDEYIKSYIKDTPYFYISILDDSESQGVIPTCDKQSMSIYKNIESLKVRCFNEKWAYYTSKTELYLLTKKYEQIGIDFVFSPFVILADFFKDKIDSTLAAYALIEDNIISLAVFNNSKLLYGESLDLQSIYEHDDVLVDNSHDEENIDIDDGIDLEGVDAFDEIEALDDFGNIEDLDSIGEIDDFDEVASEGVQDDELDIDEESEPSKLDDDMESLGGEDYNKFILIQESLSRFYKDSRYESEFIEHIYIANSTHGGSALKRYLEEEMFLSVYVRHIDLSLELCELSKREVK
jgi:hypothetical protein